jgi:hypothetical protein
MTNNPKSALLLRRIVTELEPYAILPVDAPSCAAQERCPPGTWNHTQYAVAVQGWCKFLERYAELLERRSDPLPTGERDVLGSSLFRGMGSLNDFYLDERVFGKRAKATNERLRILMSDLYSLFNS